MRPTFPRVISNDGKVRDRTAAAILEAIIDSMPDGVYVCDENHITKINLAGARLLGFDSPAEALRSVAELSTLIETRYADTLEKIPAEEEPIVLALHGTPIEREVLHRNLKTGQDVYVRCHAAPIFHEGRIIGAVAINTDITERKRAERERAALLERERQARIEAERSLALVDTFLAASPVGVAYLDRDLRYTRINDALATLNGRPAREHIGRTVAEVLPDAAPFIEPLLRGVIERCEPISGMEVTLAHPVVPDREVTILANYYPVVSGGEVQGIGGVIIDITDRKKGEQERERLLGAVDRERMLLDAVLRQVPAGVIIAEANSERILLSNEAATRIWRGPEAGDTVTHYRPGRLYHPDGKPYAPEELPLNRALSRGEYVSPQEILIHRQDDSWGYTMSSAAPVCDAEGRPIAAVVAFMDITERKQVEDTLGQALDYRDQIIGILGHDLRNPLASITLSSALLLKKEGVPDGVRKTALRIHSAAERMGGMIRDLLDFSQARFQHGLPIKPAAADLHDICRRAIEELEIAHPDHAIELHLTGDGRGHWDADRLAQVVSNLVGNALRYGDPAHPVRADIMDAGAEVTLRINNQGVPIRPDVLPTIFEPFQRGTDGSGDAPRQEGLGLGLYIVREIVLAHGGTIHVESTAEAGTTFTVRLPRHGAGS
ncbi:MAG TPA: PAS domain-containing protein [Polyangia bacterium]|jgi:PAS domain S-box-containing protein|nr:PAS domain-containing protein [Polyangia bacterium]